VNGGDTQVQQREELVITRVLDAPVERVWKAWTDPEEIKKWWGPAQFTAPVIKNDLRVGGSYLYNMRSPDGQDFWTTGTFREIVTNERIVLTDSFADEKGNVVPPSHYGMDGIPVETEITVTFEEQNGKTKLTIRHAGISDEQAKAGWNESLDKFEAILK
jgi:uncharacterized protein YndB with AHSA1/START domain